MKEDKKAMIIIFAIWFVLATLMLSFIGINADNRIKELEEDNAKLSKELDKYVDGTYRLQYMDGSGEFINVISYKHDNGVFTFYLEDYDGALVLTDKQYNDNYIMTFKLN